MERKAKGIWIPIDIWEDKSLSWNEKILFLEIDSFTSRNADCFISNEYIANLLNVTETTANKILSKLISKGYVIKTLFDGRKRYVKSALSYCATQPCHSEQPCIADYDNILNTPTDNSILNTITNKEEAKASKKAEAETPSWRTDFNAYTTLVYQAKEKLLYDAEYKAQKEKFHSNIDYALSLEKAVSEYWGTEKAWEHKKKSKSKVIDMVSTLKKAFDISSNRVYKKLQYGKPVESGFKKDIPKNKNFTFIPLNPELKFVDEEGKLNDGTFVKEGYRFYFSAKEGRSCSIPPATEPMPKSECCEYDGNLGWYEID